MPVVVWLLHGSSVLLGREQLTIGERCCNVWCMRKVVDVDVVVKVSQGREVVDIATRAARYSHARAAI